MHDEAQFVSNPPSGDSANAGAGDGLYSSAVDWRFGCEFGRMSRSPWNFGGGPVM